MKSKIMEAVMPIHMMAMTSPDLNLAYMQESNKKYFSDYCASKSHGNKGKKSRSQKQRSNRRKAKR